MYDLYFEFATNDAPCSTRHAVAISVRTTISVFHSLFTPHKQHETTTPLSVIIGIRTQRSAVHVYGPKPVKYKNNGSTNDPLCARFIYYLIFIQFL